MIKRMFEGWQKAMGHYGWVALLVLVLVGGGLVWFAAQESDIVTDPVAGSLGLVYERCPSGWTDVSASDLHVRTLACEQDVEEGPHWLVVFDSEGRFDHALPIDTIGGQTVESEAEFLKLVPEWE